MYVKTSLVNNALIDESGIRPVSSARTIHTDRQKIRHKAGGWRYEFESQIPTKKKIIQRQRDMGNNIRWTINITAHRNKIIPTSQPCNDSFDFDYRFNRPGLHEIKHHQFWDIGCTDGLPHMTRLPPNIMTWNTFTEHLGLPSRKSTHFRNPSCQKDTPISNNGYKANTHTPQYPRNPHHTRRPQNKTQMKPKK
jgi:hypothetical protein